MEWSSCLVLMCCEESTRSGRPGIEGVGGVGHRRQPPRHLHMKDISHLLYSIEMAFHVLESGGEETIHIWNFRYIFLRCPNGGKSINTWTKITATEVELGSADLKAATDNL